MGVCQGGHGIQAPSSILISLGEADPMNTISNEDDVATSCEEYDGDIERLFYFYFYF